MSTEIVAIDPGQKGAIVWWNGKKFLWWAMPLKIKDVDFFKVRKIIKQFPTAHIFLERAYGGQMGATAAFNYGRSFAALEIAIMSCKNPVTYVEPSKWCKVMHDGISSDLKPKVKSLRAIDRLFSRIAKNIPRNRNDKLHEGVVDALLIAEYGRRGMR